MISFYLLCRYEIERKLKVDAILVKYFLFRLLGLLVEAEPIHVEKLKEPVAKACDATAFTINIWPKCLG